MYPNIVIGEELGEELAVGKPNVSFHEALPPRNCLMNPVSIPCPAALRTSAESQLPSDAGAGQLLEPKGPCCPAGLALHAGCGTRKVMANIEIRSLASLPEEGLSCSLELQQPDLLTTYLQILLCLS